MSERVKAVLREHRADMWSCSCGWPLNDSVGSVVDHLAAELAQVMRCPTVAPDGSQCRLFPGHDGMHGDGDCTTWDRDYAAPATPERRRMSGNDAARLREDEREALDAILVALWQCETEVGYEWAREKTEGQVERILTARLDAAEAAQRDGEAVVECPNPRVHVWFEECQFVGCRNQSTTDVTIWDREEDTGWGISACAEHAPLLPEMRHFTAKQLAAHDAALASVQQGDEEERP